MDEVDFTVLAAKSVFSDMIDKCPPAETCRDAFDRTAKTTIKMASSTGGFGNPMSATRRQADATNWGNATGMTSKSVKRRSHPRQDQQPFQFDLSLSDTLSSPGLSAGTDGLSQASPGLGKSKTFDSDYVGGAQPRSNPGMADDPSRTNQESVTPVDATMATSPNMVRRMTTQQPPSGNTIMGQQFGLQGPVDYPDSQTMDFLSTLGATSNGDFTGGTIDQAQLDLGFGMNWEGMTNDYSEGQQINPFDTFFFGGQQHQQGGGGANGGMGL